MEAQPERKHILVIGAGVIGLQCANTLLHEGQDQYQVSVVAEYLPGDEPGIYASAWAGAQWRSHEPSYTEAAEWDMQTYRYWTQLIEESVFDTGVAIMQGRNYWASNVTAGEKNPTEIPTPWWADYVKCYKRFDEPALPQNTALGVAFDTFTVDPQRYLHFLLRQIGGSGAQIARARLPTDRGFKAAVQAAAVALGMTPESQFWAVINASGIQARDLVKDTSLYPIRGQTVVVRGVAQYCITRLGVKEEDRVAVMPRPAAGTTVIGVTVEPNVFSTEVDQASVAKLLNCAKPYCSELLNQRGEFDIVRVGVGIRPGRKDGARVELEQVDGLRVVHAYGTAGAGYQNSVGIARKVLKLLQ